MISPYLIYAVYIQIVKDQPGRPFCHWHSNAFSSQPSSSLSCFETLCYFSVTVCYLYITQVVFHKHFNGQWCCQGLWCCFPHYIAKQHTIQQHDILLQLVRSQAPIFNRIILIYFSVTQESTCFST